MSKTRVLVADDSSLIRSAITDVLEESGDFEVVAEAASGIETLMLARRVDPDIISLDVEMPRIDGLGVLTRLMRSQPTKVVLVSSHTAIGADVTLEGLSLGAIDFVPKASVGEPFEHFAGRLLHVFRTVQAAQTPGLRTIAADDGLPVSTISDGLRMPAVVGVAASTGGPDALNRFFGAFTQRPPVPFLVVQHMPATFTNRLASRLDRVGPLAILEATDGVPLEAGVAFVAPGDHHIVSRDGVVVFDDHPPIGGLKPRADITFESLAVDHGPGALGVILTGMGDDGLKGASSIVQEGGQTVAQDETSATIDGMPRRIREAGLAIASGPPEQLAVAIENTWTNVTTSLAGRAQ